MPLALAKVPPHAHRNELPSSHLCSRATPAKPLAAGTSGGANPADRLAIWARFIAPEALDQYRGGSATINSEAVSNGLLQNATATRVATGNNSIADGSFSHAMGLPIVIQNSGANVLIQNSTIVNVQFR